MSIGALLLVGLPSRQTAPQVPFMRAHLILEGASSPSAARLPRYSFDKVRERARTSMASSAQTALFSRSTTASMLVQALFAVVSMPPPAVPAHAAHSCPFFMLQVLRPSSVLAGGAATSVLVWCLPTRTLINNTHCTVHTHMLARPVPVSFFTVC